MRARRSECQSPRAEPQGPSVGSPRGAWEGAAAAAEDEAREDRHAGGRRGAGSEQGARGLPDATRGPDQ